MSCQAFFEQTCGLSSGSPLAAFRSHLRGNASTFNAEQWEICTEYLLVDGTTSSFAWDELERTLCSFSGSASPQADDIFWAPLWASGVRAHPLCF